MKNTIDISYIALELVKTYSMYGSDYPIAHDNIVKLYKEMLCELLDIEKLPDIAAIEEENEALKEKLHNQAKSGLTDREVNELLCLLDDFKGDMEPAVYDKLKGFIYARSKSIL